MYLTGYVKKFGNLSFREKPFNSTDALVLATAIYSNFEVVAPSIMEKNAKPVLIKNISNFDLTVVTAGKILVRGNKQMIPAMRASRRFGNIGVNYLHKIFDQNSASQFYACTFIIPGVGSFIAIRGTDASVVGWVEDLNISVNKVLLSHLDAIEYVKIVSERVKGPLYIGGHSKGGNFTLYTSIFIDKEIQDRIVKAYSFEGNGLSYNSYYSDPKYLAIKDRIVFVCPKDSVVGEIMYNPKECIVVKSKSFFVLQHDSHTWKLHRSTGEFNVAKRRTKESLLRHWALKDWLKNIPIKERQLMIRYFTFVFGGIDKTIFHFLLRPGKIIRIIKACKEFNKEDRQIIKERIKDLSKCNKDAKIKYKEKYKEYKRTGVEFRK